MTSAETEAAAPAISSSFPLPISVAGSGRSLRCVNSPTISAPALDAKVRNSSSESSDVNSDLNSEANSAGKSADSEGNEEEEEEEEEDKPGDEADTLAA